MRNRMKKPKLVTQPANLKPSYMNTMKLHFAMTNLQKNRQPFEDVGKFKRVQKTKKTYETSRREFEYYQRPSYITYACKYAKCEIVGGLILKANCFSCSVRFFLDFATVVAVKGN